MEQQAQITIQRTTNHLDRLRSYKIKLNGTIVGKVKAGESTTIAIAPGRHSIVLRIDWCGSEMIVFEAKPAQHLHFECGSNITGWRILLMYWYITFQTNQYLWFKQSV
jgi:hypothetical protein